MRFSFKYRCYPTKPQAEFLAGELRDARFLYNAAKQERDDAWKICHKSPLLAGVGRCLRHVFLGSPALFEIHNIRTSEAAVQFEPFTDGTLADRAARELGRDWRVFRQESQPQARL